MSATSSQRGDTLITPRRLVSTAGMLAATLLALTTCAPGDMRTSNDRDEPTVMVHPPSDSPIDWLFTGEGSDVLAALPGSVWNEQSGAEVAVVCGPTDEHEGWQVSGTVVDTDVGEDFDPGDDFEEVHATGQRTWEYVRDRRLRLVERDAGGVNFEFFVPTGQAPIWAAGDQRDVDVVSGPERCG